MFHVDDVKGIHKGKKVVENFYQWIYFIRGDSTIGKVKSVRGKFDAYLSMALYYTNS